MESLLVASFVAGFLTVLAPCLLPLLPVIIGSSLSSTIEVKRNPYIIIGSLLLSIVVFTLIIQFLSSIFYIPQTVWTTIAATLIFIVGITFLFPAFWKRLPFVSRFYITSNATLGKGLQRKGTLGDIIIGFSLGPVFTSCSPTYFIILAVVLPVSILNGIGYLFAYALGLGTILLFIALLGQSLIEKMTFFADDKGYFKKIIGLLLILVAIAIYTGYDKHFATFTLEHGFFDVTQYEIKVTR